ncbi:MAG: AIR synthase family protein [Halanaeroarchaeum sp.]
MDPGKVDRAFFEQHIGDRLGADRADVRLEPAHGADFGAIDVGDRVVALATDPLFVLRDLGLERAAWFAFHIVVSDVALSGIPPTHLTVDFNLPPETDAATFETIWSVFDREARDLGIGVVTGHTGAYAGTAFPTIGGATGIAVGDPADLVLPTGAQPGDVLVATKGPAVETTAVLATVFGDRIEDLPTAAIDAARDRFREMAPVYDALTAAAAAPVTAMHDATEGGVDTALLELARASEVGLAVERDRFPIGDGVRAVCEHFDIDPWVASSEGTVLMTVGADGVGALLEALAAEGIRAARVGEVTGESDVVVDGESIVAPERDPFWPAYERAREEYGTPQR